LKQLVGKVYVRRGGGLLSFFYCTFSGFFFQDLREVRKNYGIAGKFVTIDVYVAGY
jgi:hypothetical protein